MKMEILSMMYLKSIKLLLIITRTFLQKIFYFDNQINTLNEFIECKTIPQLKESDTNLCEEPITQCELDEALKTMENCSAPGLTTEFYNFFRDKIGHTVYQST